MLKQLISIEPLNHTALSWWWIAAMVVGLDQLTKGLANAYLTLHTPWQILPFFNFTLMYNYGAAFSLLAEAGGWQRWFLTGLAFIVSILLIIWLARTSKQQILLAISLMLILGGAIGNMLDRIIFGYVIDFIDIYYQNWHWPAFNIADTAITLGAIGLLIETFWGKSQ